MNICTIVASNYIPQARVLASSLARVHPELRLTTLIVDPMEPPPSEPFEVIFPEALGLSLKNIHHLAMIYTPVELCTALKPHLLSWVLRQGEPAVYLDPDMEVFARLDEVVPMTARHDIVLTPHVTEPIPRDGLRPTELHILEAGVYNMGFIAVGRGAQDFLDWWAERLLTDSIVDPRNTLFVDQRWVDFVPALWEPFLLKDPGYNVAFWNLHSRKIEKGPEGLTVNGRPLRFFHYSAFDPRRPGELSKNQGDMPRVRLSERPDVKELTDRYAAALISAGYDEAIGRTYGWARTPQGNLITVPMRRAYRKGVVEAQDLASRPPNPFDVDEETFVSWLAQPVELSMPAVSRYLAAIYEERADVRGAHPGVMQGNPESFIGWVKEHGVKEYEIPGGLVPE
ncbi:MAG TPA: hypothetical protein VI541_03900 [Actinomycetota bacterium]|nr:hypothetical protein [Actinomycetota bacterium]